MLCLRTDVAPLIQAVVARATGRETRRNRVRERLWHTSSWVLPRPDPLPTSTPFSLSLSLFRASSPSLSPPPALSRSFASSLSCLSRGLSLSRLRPPWSPVHSTATPTVFILHFAPPPPHPNASHPCPPHKAMTSESTFTGRQEHQVVDKNINLGCEIQ